jgi:hypothetical protein
MDCTVAAAVAITAGWRVSGLVTPVDSLSRSVATAQAPIITQGSAAKDCESMNIWPSHPSASIRLAASIEVVLSEPPARQNSTIFRPWLDCDSSQ